MSQKRKLIKKSRPSHKSNLPFQQTEVQVNQSLFQKLKSVNPSQKQQAITVLANLHIFYPQFYQPQFVRSLVNLLYQVNNYLAYQTLFALANLSQLQPKIVPILFQNGLDKALMQLNSTDKELLKPILIFFITIADNIPNQYYYLLKGIQNSLNINHLKLNCELCLQFLFRTHNLPSLDFKLPQQMLKQIAAIFSASDDVVQKSYAVAILAQSLQNQNQWNAQIEQILRNFLTDMIVCIDLQKQYRMNFSQEEKVQNQRQNNMCQQVQTQKILQNQLMGDKKFSQSQKTEKLDQIKKKNQKLKFFFNTIEGLQILLQFILNILQKGQNRDQQDQQQMEDFQEQNMNQEIKTNLNKTQTQSNSLNKLIISFIGENMTIFPKFLSLSTTIVPSSQNIVYLFYNLLIHVDKQLGLSNTSNQQNKIQINQLIQMSLQNLFSTIQKSQKSSQNISLQQYDILVECLQIGLKIILKNKVIGINQKQLIQFTKKYMIAAQIFKSLRLFQQIKPSWLVMLQIYSKIFNPQKNKNVTKQQNYQIGSILKVLIVSTPFNQLQQLRCQAIDTIFDVYSNQQFDQAFVELGLFNILQTVLGKSQNKGSKQNSTKQRKKQKFVNEVLKDMTRFLEYKKKMIKKV